MDVKSRAFKWVVSVALLLSIFNASISQNAGAVSAAPVADCSAVTTCTVTFAYTGDYYSWTVPLGVSSIVVDAYGAAGGLSNYRTNTATASKGGRVQATLSATAGETLYIYVGGAGTTASGTSIASSAGWNGGGKGGYGNLSVAYWGSGGGGASDIRTSVGVLSSRILVAGGGGGSACNVCGAADNGGNGGGLTGANGATAASGSVVAGGGTQSAGGNSNKHGAWGVSQAGSLGIGGDAQAVDSNSSTADMSGGGGGGGGYYGGGGGSWVGGGGGSSYTDAVRATSVTHTQGARSGNGLITVTYVPIPATVSLSLAGNPASATKGQAITLTANVNYAGLVTFYADGKKIAGCISMTTSAGTKTCNWKPTVQKSVRITVDFLANGVGSRITSQSFMLAIVKRINTR